MYNSIDEPKNKDQIPLNSEQLQLVDSFIDPDAPKTLQVHFDLDAACLRELLGCLLTDRDTLEHALAIGAKPDWFQTDQQAAIYKALIFYQDKYKELPSKPILEQLIKQDIRDRYKQNPETGAAMEVLFLAELHTVFDWHRSAVQQTKSYYRDCLTALAKKVFYLRKFEEMKNAIKKKEPFDSIAESFSTDFQRIKNLGIRRIDPIQTWAEMCEEAEAEKQEWIIDKILMTRSMNMISGKSFSGKTTILNRAMAAICEGSSWLGHTCNPYPVCYLNCDRNRTSRIRRKVYANMEHPDKDEILAKRFFSVWNDSMAETLTANDFQRFHQSLKRRVGDEPILFVVDTFRSAFLADVEMGATNDDSTMIKLLKPIQKWAVESGNCILLVHHNTKHVDDYAGSGAYLMLLESKLNYKREEDSPTGELRIITRDDLQLKYFIGLDSNFKPYKTDGKALTDDPFVKTVVSDIFNSVNSISQAFEIYKSNGGTSCKSTFTNLVNTCIEEKRLIRVEGAGGSRGAKYKRA